LSPDFWQAHYFPNQRSHPPEKPWNSVAFFETLRSTDLDALERDLIDKMSVSKNKYSVILPTYNERQNLPVLVQMLSDTFTKE
jgi:hypothetical protein